MTKSKHNPTDFLQKASHVGMAASDKARVRDTLLRYSEGAPVRVGAPDRHTSRSSRFIPSPYQVIFTKKRMPIAIAAMIAVLFGGGTAYAAQGSLPGSTLYPIKVHVDEPVREAFAFTPSAQANVQASIASDRLTEASQLAAKGKLSTSTAASLAADFTTHEQAALAKANGLDKTNPVAAAALKSSLAARIAANKSILGMLATGDASDTPAIQGIVAALSAHLAHEDNFQLSASSTAAAHFPDQVLTSLQHRAQDRFASAQRAVANASSSRAATTTTSVSFMTQARAALTVAQNDLSTASSSLAAGNNASAYTALVSSLNASEQAKAYAQAASRLRIRLESVFPVRGNEHFQPEQSEPMQPVGTTTLQASTTLRVQGGEGMYEQERQKIQQQQQKAEQQAQQERQRIQQQIDQIASSSRRIQQEGEIQVHAGASSSDQTSVGATGDGQGHASGTLNLGAGTGLTD